MLRNLDFVPRTFEIAIAPFQFALVVVLMALIMLLSNRNYVLSAATV